MSDQDQSSSASPQAPEILIQDSAGALLRTAREKAGLHIESLAVSLKVPVNKIEAIEADRFDLLPDIVFARALASSMCRALKIDPTPVLGKMPSSSLPPMKTDESGINAPFKVSGGVSGLTLLRPLSKPVVLAVMALLASAIILFFTPLLPKTGDSETAVSNDSETTQVESNAYSSSGSLTQTSEVVVIPAPVLASSDVSSVNAMESVEVPTKPLASSTTVGVSSPTNNGSDRVTGLLVLKARDASWVQVTDAAGVVQVRKTLQPGDLIGVSGLPPLSVVLGRADVIDVQVKGQPFDISTKTKENIARFEVR